MTAIDLVDLNEAIKYHTKAHDEATDPEARRDHLFALGILCKQRKQEIEANMIRHGAVNQVFYDIDRGEDDEC